MAWASEIALLALVAAAAAARGNATVNLTPRIVGGRPVKIVDYPFMASLQMYDRHACGATILSPLWLLTAKHCFFDPLTGEFVKLSALAVLAGTSVSDSAADVAEMQIVHSLQYRTVASVFVNLEESLHSDVGIAVVDTPFEWTKWVRPVVLAGGVDLQPGTRCVALGWGHAQPLPTAAQRAQGAPAETPASTMVLQMVELPLISTAVCKQYFLHVVNDTHICTLEEGKDACIGDSGGPLLCGNRQVALVWGGDGCAQKGVPGVYTRVLPVLTLLKRNAILDRATLPRARNATRRLDCAPAAPLLLLFLLLLLLYPTDCA